MKKIILISLGILFLLGSGIVVYQYNKPHRKIAKEKTDYNVNAQALYTDYQQDEAAANKKYLNKVLEVKGKIAESYTDGKGNRVLLIKDTKDFFGVSCTFPKNNPQPAVKAGKGEVVTVKGICTGGGTMMDVILVNCTLVE